MSSVNLFLHLCLRSCERQLIPWTLFQHLDLAHRLHAAAPVWDAEAFQNDHRRTDGYIGVMRVLPRRPLGRSGTHHGSDFLLPQASQPLAGHPIDS